MTNYFHFKYCMLLHFANRTSDFTTIIVTVTMSCPALFIVVIMSIIFLSCIFILPLASTAQKWTGNFDKAHKYVRQTD